MNLSDFHLLKEDDSSYQIKHPNGKSLTIGKNGLSERAHKMVKEMCKGGMYADGGEVTEAQPEVQQDVPIQQPMSSQATPEQMQSIPDQSQPQMTPASVPVVNPEITSNAGPAPMSQAAPDQTKALINSPFEAEKKAELEKAQAIQQQSAQESKALDDVNAKIAGMPTQQDVIAKNNEKDQALFKAYQDQKIDPLRYIHNMSTGSKIAAGIAMVLGGAGAGVSGQPNLSYNMVQKAVENDIEAQRSEQGKALNLWKLNREQLGSDLQANLATQNQMYTGLKYQLQKAAVQAQSPLAKANADQAIAVINQHQMVNTFKMGALSDGVQRSEQEAVNNIKQLQMVDPKLADELQKKYIPGVGQSRIPLESKDREALEHFNALNQRFQEANAFLKQMGGIGAWSGENRAKAQALRSGITTEMGQLVQLNRMTEQEGHLYSERMPDFGAVKFTNADQSKMNDLMTELGQKKKAFEQSFGITPFKQAPQDQQAMAWAQKNPNDPRAQNILRVNGVK